MLKGTLEKVTFMHESKQKSVVKVVGFIRFELQSI
jgi:hypothetical protein